MQVGNVCKLLGCQTTVEGVHSLDAVILHLQVGLHEVDIGCQILKQRTGKRTAEHRDAHIRILLGQRIDNGHRHSHIAQRRESYDENMVVLHFLL